jgi:hypothetical protein
MANTYTLISSNVLASSAASVTFSAIPATYTDLVVRWSARSDRSSNIASILVTMNGSSSGYSYTYLLGNGGGAAASSARAASQTSNLAFYITAATATANTFASGDLYYPNYAGSANKVMSSDVAHEDNTSVAYLSVLANLWQNTAAITSITLTASQSSNFVSGSSFYLYGIKST